MVKLNNKVWSNNYNLTSLNDIGFVSTFSFKELSDSKVSNGALDLNGSGLGGEMIVSAKLVLGSDSVKLLTPSYIISNLRNQVINFENIYVIEVSLDLDAVVGKFEDVFDLNEILTPVTHFKYNSVTIQDIRGKDFEFFFYKCHLNYFLSNIKTIVSLGSKSVSEPMFGRKDINISPIIIFRCGLSWSNLISLIQLQNIVVHGGSISRRHKISLNEYKLSIFLFLSGLTGSVEQFYGSYVDKFFSSSSLVPDLYGFRHINRNLAGYKPSNGVLLDYYLLNKQISTIIELEVVNKNILSLEQSIAGLNDFISSQYDQDLETLALE